MDESTDWTSCMNSLPPIDKWVIVFRKKTRRYTIAKLELAFEKYECRLDKNMGPQERKVFWRTSFGNLLSNIGVDYWMPFAPFTLTETFE